MTDLRRFLTEALRRVANGGEIDNAELDAIIADPFVLDPAERKAWEELSHWADDTDIRANDACYAVLKRERMRDRLSELSRAGG
ncbi:MAG: hypothetical protein PGN21_12090 [Sphingomonas paucimobilis]